MVKRYKKGKKLKKQIAEGRINHLFQLAEREAINGYFDLSDRYVDIARRKSMRTLVKIPSKYKRNFCKNCYKYLLPSATSRVRIKRGHIIIFCNNCKKITRIPLKK